MEFNHDLKNHRVSATIDGETAFVEYEMEEGELNILHTFVPSPLEGQGFASELVKFVYDYALSQNLKPVATCSYAAKWLQRHPEYSK